MISEGLIKIPESLYQELSGFVLKWYLAYVFAQIERRFKFDEAELEASHRLVTTACKKYNVQPTQADIRIAREKFVFTKTFMLDQNAYGEQIQMKVRFRLVLERQGTQDLGSYNDKTGFIIISAYNMHMTGASLNSVSAVRHSLGKIDELLAHLRHELTHLVQFRALAVKHPKQIASSYNVDDEYSDSYALSQLEFDPLLKSAQGKFAKLRSKYRAVPGYSERALQDAFLCVTQPPLWMTDEDQSGFFNALKRRAPLRWKKAVKLFTAS